METHSKETEIIHLKGPKALPGEDLLFIQTPTGTLKLELLEIRDAKQTLWQRFWRFVTRNPHWDAVVVRHYDTHATITNKE